MPKTSNGHAPARTPARSKTDGNTGSKALASSPEPRSAPVPNTSSARRRTARPTLPAPLPPVAAKAMVTQARKRRGAAAAAVPKQNAQPATSSASAASPQSASSGGLPDRIPVPNPGNKQEQVLSMLRRRQGASVAELMQRTGWLSHSVRGLLSAVIKRKLGLDLACTVEQERGRVYRILDENAARAAGRGATAIAGGAG